MDLDLQIEQSEKALLWLAELRRVQNAAFYLFLIMIASFCFFVEWNARELSLLCIGCIAILLLFHVLYRLLELNQSSWIAARKQTFEQFTDNLREDV